MDSNRRCHKRRVAQFAQLRADGLFDPLGAGGRLVRRDEIERTIAHLQAKTIRRLGKIDSHGNATLRLQRTQENGVGIAEKRRACRHIGAMVRIDA